MRHDSARLGFVKRALAERIDHLFRTQLSPRGREYTHREVAAAVTGQNGTTFSPAETDSRRR